MSRSHTQPSSLPSTKLVSLNPPVLKWLLHVSPAKCFPLVLAKELGSVSQANRKWLQDYAQTAQKGKTNMQQKRTNTKQKGYTGPPTVPTWWCKALVNGIRSQFAYKEHSSIMEFYHGSIIYKLRNFQWMNNISSARKILFYSTLQNKMRNTLRFTMCHESCWRGQKMSIAWQQTLPSRIFPTPVMGGICSLVRRWSVQRSAVAFKALEGIPSTQLNMTRQCRKPILPQLCSPGMLQLLADVVAARTTALIATNRFRRAAFFQAKVWWQTATRRKQIQ